MARPYNNVDTLRRPPFPNRPWIRGGLYDNMRRTTVLHCDAYVYSFGGRYYLYIEWREGGFKAIAYDAYVIEPDGLTPVWDAEFVKAAGKLVFMGDHGDVIPWGPLHSRVAHEVEDVQGRFARWLRVTLQAHYVPTPDIDCETFENHWKPRAPRKPKAVLPDIL